jgi:hypothetical protein
MASKSKSNIYTKREKERDRDNIVDECLLRYKDAHFIYYALTEKFQMYAVKAVSAVVPDLNVNVVVVDALIKGIVTQVKRAALELAGENTGKVAALEYVDAKVRVNIVADKVGRVPVVTVICIPASVPVTLTVPPVPAPVPATADGVPLTHKKWLA